VYLNDEINFINEEKMLAGILLEGGDSRKDTE
jgi:hypothetical protein